MIYHRVAIEVRSGIWLLFLETEFKNGYKQELVRIFGHRIRIEIRFMTAEKAGMLMIADRHIETPLIIRDDFYKNQVTRSATKVIKKQLYIYCWGNNEKREAMKGRTCRVLSRGKKNSCAVEFIDNGQTEIVSRNALRKV
ncbi:hypothetical protein LCGC14_0390830 [marine sediment metagenome]|uniref:Uncharacterized protein n=1 Tax=marine sediment metagenome TaxID=412755 RepID=A0A0F9W8S4_9ZZZZ